MTPPAVSVLVPTLDEATRLERLLDDIDRLREELSVEVVVADGGSGDGTREIARRRGAQVIVSSAGRGHQLSFGAAACRGSWLFVVHADCTLPAAARRALAAHVRAGDTERFAHFDFALADDRPAMRWVEWGQRLRERCLGLVYGDQGLLVSRSLYERTEGYPRWRLFEDIEIVDRLRRAGGQRTRLQAVLPTSARRYRSDGVVSALRRNVRIATSFRLGGDPERLARRYPPHRRPPTRTVVVFAKEPTAGRVKTRLARDVGDEEAVRIYRSLAEATVGTLQMGGWRLLVYADPPDDGARARVAGWLGLPPSAVKPQSVGDLGTRMSAALHEALRDTERVCIVGTDLPGMDVHTIDRAFEALDRADVVFGPATDGGYYLIATKTHHPRLFDDIPWSTASVLPTSLDRARTAGLRTELLDPRTDVDTLEDVPEALLGP